MTERQKIVEVSVITDFDTNMYKIGEVDFSIPASGDYWVSKSRKEIVETLRWLADRCEKKQYPFKEDKTK